MTCYKLFLSKYNNSLHPSSNNNTAFNNLPYSLPKPSDDTFLIPIVIGASSSIEIEFYIINLENSTGFRILISREY